MSFTVSVSATAQLTINLPTGITGLIPTGLTILSGNGGAVNTTGVLTSVTTTATQISANSWTPGVGSVAVSAWFPTAN